MTKNSIPRVEAKEVRPSKAKKTYRAPQLTEYGHIAKLTAGTTGSSTDKGTLANVHGSPSESQLAGPRGR